uniref:WGS project CAEQ00000000 data, annotated contig 1547 n=1 Tax=Trypanosoma congolense (strain IL3000) TaxID=1068625 RepID=F9W707_TRYCI|nr:unnamed protein product [Trypanosoma congolense IL3000]
MVTGLWGTRKIMVTGVVGPREDYGDRRGGTQGDYGDRRGGNQGDYVDRRGGNQGDYGARDRRSCNDCEAPTAFVGEIFDEQSAKSLFELKRQFKLSKSEKERREIQRSARRLVRRARVDPSTQDEKSVTLLLNCAAMFRCYPHTEGIKQATDWMRKNIDGLSPQNIALFANAVGALWVMDSETILVNEISPAAEAVYRQMRSVELVMILQAFQRGKIVENSSLQISMLQQLLSLVPQMPIPQLTTLAGVLVDTPLRKSDEASWRGAVDTVVSLAVSSVEKMHSRETISLLKAAPRLDVMEKHSLQLIERAIGTAGFHTDEQVGELFEAVATYRGQQKPCSGELNEKLDELISVLWTRLQKVAPFADAVSATAIMRWARLSGVDVPRDILDVLVQAVKRELPYHRFTFRRVALLGEALALQNASAKELLYLLGDYCIGKRPTRGDRGGRDVDDDDHPQVDVRMDIYSRFLGDLTRARLALENAYSANTDNGEPGESVCSTLPQRLEASVMSASPREVLKSLQVIFTAEDCSLRNRASDDKIIALAEERVVKEGASFMEDLRKATVEKFVTAVKTIPRAEKMIDVLTSCVK